MPHLIIQHHHRGRSSAEHGSSNYQFPLPPAILVSISTPLVLTLALALRSSRVRRRCWYRRGLAGDSVRRLGFAFGGEAVCKCVPTPAQTEARSASPSCLCLRVRRRRAAEEWREGAGERERGAHCGGSSWSVERFNSSVNRSKRVYAKTETKSPARTHHAESARYRTVLSMLHRTCYCAPREVAREANGGPDKTLAPSSDPCPRKAACPRFGARHPLLS